MKYIYVLSLFFVVSGCLKAKKSSFDLSGKSLKNGGTFLILNSVSGKPSGSQNTFSYDQSSITITSGTVMANLVPDLIGTFSSFKVTPSLPNGISLNPITGEISGTPTSNQNAIIYTIQGNSSTNSFQFQLSITINSNPPSSLIYNGISSGMATGSIPTALLFRRTIAGSVKPTILGSATFTISPTLPSGLSLNSTNGTISGTATVSQLALNYTVTATNGFGNTSFSFSIAVLPVIYAATFGGGLGISTDGGNTFTMRTVANSSLAADTLNQVYITSNGTIYVATNSNGISYSSNNGTSFTNKLPVNQVFSVFADNVGNIYAGNSSGGLSISTNGGISFSNKTTANGLGDNRVNFVTVVSGVIYAGTGFGNGNGGLSYSSDGGTTFINRRDTDGFGVTGTYAGKGIALTSTGVIFGGNNAGVSFSSNGGVSFTNKTTANGLGSDSTLGVAISPSNHIFVGTISGLSISTNGGVSFTNKTTANGLPNNGVSSVFVYADGTVYAGTSSGIGVSTDNGTSFTTRNGANGLTNISIQDVFAR